MYERLPDDSLLAERDQRIATDLQRVRLLTGRQIERLHFGHIQNPTTRASIRRRTMNRLQTQQLVTTLPRKIGGERAGSAGLVYTLDSAGHRLFAASGRVRRPWAIGSQFVAHTLDVAECYVQLIEHAQQHQRGQLLAFDAEPSCWFQAGHVLLKPDAFVTWVSGGLERHSWVEVDRATESLPTLTNKLGLYVAAANSGHSGPGGVFPAVVVSVPSAARQKAVQKIIGNLPPPASDLIRCVLLGDLCTALTEPP